MILVLCCIAILLHLLGLPWWVMLVLIFAAAFIKPTKNAFVRGFAVLFISWTILCLWPALQNGHILSSRIASMFGLPGWWALVICTALLGGIVGGMASLSGQYLCAWTSTARAKLS